MIFIVVKNHARSVNRNGKHIDPPLADVKPAAAFASVNSQLMTLAHMSGSSVPELERDAVSIGDSTIFEECLATSGISARKNQLRSRHPSRPSGRVVARLEAGVSAGRHRRARPNATGLSISPLITDEACKSRDHV